MRKATIFFSLLFVFCVEIFAEGERITTDHFVITYENISPEMAQRFAEQAEVAFNDVTTYLSKKYGQGRINIYVGDKYDMPQTNRGGGILIPANRIRGDAPGPPSEIAGRGPSITHEITHVISLSQGKPSRYLDEGLAVFMQEKFGTDKSYPNMGGDVHRITAKLIKTIGEFIAIDKLEKTRDASVPENLRRLAYLQEGSFVRYLIEEYGLNDFMAMYEGKSYEKIYNKSIEDLENEWKEFIRGI